MLEKKVEQDPVKDLGTEAHGLAFGTSVEFPDGGLDSAKIGSGGIAHEARTGMGLALSGGGYRATLFALGSLWRLNDLGWLSRLRQVTSVSGGSIAAAVLASRWKQLKFDEHGVASNFQELIVGPIRAFCKRTLDWKAGLMGLIPFVSPSRLTTRLYARHLLTDSEGHIYTLADLPQASEGPEFIFYATGMQTGSSFRFSRDGLYDWKLGTLKETHFSLAQATAASAAFPPVLSPLILKTDPKKWRSSSYASSLKDANRIRRRLVLADGGIYDNMGIEAIWKQNSMVLVSDAGAPFEFHARPWSNWYGQLSGVRNILIQQTRALRRRMLMRDFDAGVYKGVYWGISTAIINYRRQDAMCVDTPVTRALSGISTRLKALDDVTQERLINWSYALADTALRCHVDQGLGQGKWPCEGNALRSER